MRDSGPSAQGAAVAKFAVAAEITEDTEIEQVSACGEPLRQKRASYGGSQDAAAGSSLRALWLNRAYAADRRLLAQVSRSIRMRRKALFISFCSGSEPLPRFAALISTTVSGDSEVMVVERRVLVSAK